MASKVDQELESDATYRRVLAELPAEEKLRLLGADFDLQRELAKKREYRRMLAELSAAEKLRLLETLRNRSEIQRGKRRISSTRLPANAPTMASEHGQARAFPQKKKKYR